jgi:hypothetical protein
MKFIDVDKSNISSLFKMNRELAVEEEQEELFTVKEAEYKQSFLNDNPVVYGILIFKEGELVGFAIYLYKFATYKGKKILHIEDIYLKQPYKTPTNIQQSLQFFNEKMKGEDCCRLELRVLHQLNIGIPELQKAGFNKIEKWDVYRFEDSKD